MAPAGPLEERVATLEVAVTALQAENAALNARLAAVESNSVMDLDGYVRLEPSTIEGVLGPNVIFDGVNLHLQSGDPSRSTVVVNGYGNLVIGYNEPPDVLDPGDREGSHNLILGRAHKYPSTDGIAHGWGAQLNRHAAAALASDGNIHNSVYSATVGGQNNVAQNVSGIVLIGGRDNIAEGYKSVIVGGQNNMAQGRFSTVTGGQYNTSLGSWSSIGGGLGHTAAGDHDWMAGSLWEDQ